MGGATLSEMLTSREVAAYLRVPLSTIYLWHKAGGGPRRIKVGKHVRYLRADLEAWLERHAVSEVA